MQKSKYSHLVFDIDGTLIDTEDMLLDVFGTVIRQCYGVPFTRAQFRTTFGLPCEEALRTVGLIPRPEVMPLIQQGIARSLDKAHVFDGVPEMLEGLTQRDITLGILTSKNREEYRLSFIPFGLAAYFDGIVCADDTPRGKPYPDPLLLYMKKCGVTREQIAYIGDTAHDQLCAQAAGVDFFLADWGYTAPSLRAASPKLSRPADIFRLL